MTFDAVYEFINQVCETEATSRDYRRRLATQLDSLHRSVFMDGKDPAKDLCNFVMDYSRIAPRTLDCIHYCAHQSGTLSLFQASLDVAVRYFLNPSELVSQQPSIANLLIRSYQCHRLIEELYDNNKSLRNQHIHDTQTTQANLLAHHLIGEPLANDIDSAIYSVFRKLVCMPDYYDLDLQHFLESCNDDAWLSLKEDWVGLLTTHCIKIKFAVSYSI